MARAIRQLTPMTDTVAIQNGKPSDRFVVGWGLSGAVGEDDLREAEKRQKMGRKMTPIGAGTLKPGKR